MMTRTRLWMTDKRLIAGLAVFTLGVAVGALLSRPGTPVTSKTPPATSIRFTGFTDGPSSAAPKQPGQPFEFNGQTVYLVPLGTQR